MEILQYKPKKSHKILSFIRKEPLFSFFIGFLILSFGTVSLCKAYSYVMQSYMENSLKQAAQTSYEANTSCEANRKAYIEWKIENGLVPSYVDSCKTF
jgi:hypothetical protein